MYEMISEIVIDRYIYDVTRRLPVKDRADAEAGLRADISGLMAGKTGDERAAVLHELGSPAALAGKYLRVPRFLGLSPALYGKYRLVLKRAAPAVCGVLMAIGAALGTGQAAGIGAMNLGSVVFRILLGALAGAAAGALLAVLTVTACFIIAERAGYRPGAKGLRIKKLPHVPTRDKNEISKAGSILSLIGIILLSVSLVIEYFYNFRSTLYLYPREDILTSEVSTALFVFFITLFALAFIDCAVRLRVRRWTPLVCGLEIFSCVSILGMALYIVMRAETFTQGFLQFLAEVRENGLQLIFVGENVAPQTIEIDGASINAANPALRPGIYAAGVIIISLICLARAAYRLHTARFLKKQAARGDDSRA